MKLRLFICTALIVTQISPIDNKYFSLKKEVRAWSSNPQTREWLNNEKARQECREILVKVKKNMRDIPGDFPWNAEQPLREFVNIINMNVFWTVAHHFKFEKQFKKYLTKKKYLTNLDKCDEQCFGGVEMLDDQFCELLQEVIDGEEKEKIAQALVTKANKEAIKALQPFVN